MNEEMIDFLLNYSTADFQKTISAENDPRYTEANVPTVFFPPGQYRVIAGKLMRVREGLPTSELVANSPATGAASTRSENHG